MIAGAVVAGMVPDSVTLWCCRGGAVVLSVASPRHSNAPRHCRLRPEPRRTPERQRSHCGGSEVLFVLLFFQRSCFSFSSNMVWGEKSDTTARCWEVIAGDGQVPSYQPTARGRPGRQRAAGGSQSALQEPRTDAHSVGRGCHFFCPG